MIFREPSRQGVSLEDLERFVRVWAIVPSRPFMELMPSTPL